MSLLFEITLKPRESKVYWRLVLVANILTTALVLYSAVYFLIKCTLIILLSMLIYCEWRNKKTSNGIKEIQFIGGTWRIVTESDLVQFYSEVHILISNPLFQLLQFINTKQKKILVLFKDQLTESELRVLQLKIAQS